MAVNLTPIEGGITAARGFVVAGVRCGIKKSQRRDVALIVCTDGAASAAGRPRPFRDSQ
jgi:glutamate N-acetyltransferase / amino-acid N-acetyltransferase